MFIFTTKFNRKKAVLAVLALAVVLVAIILLAGNTDRNNAKETAALSAVVKNNDQRVNYLKALGWEVEKTALEEQKVVIPRQFSNVYKKYNDLQMAQGFDLTKYGGLEAMRYTYKVLNYPGATGNVVADIIVYRDEIIAGDVQSNALDGFMVGLEYPKDTARSMTSPNTALPSKAPSSSAVPSSAPNTALPTTISPGASPNASKPNAAKTDAASDNPSSQVIISDSSAADEASSVAQPSQAAAEPAP